MIKSFDEQWACCVRTAQQAISIPTRNGGRRSAGFWVFEADANTIPLLTLRRVAVKSCWFELGWFLKGNMRFDEIANHSIAEWWKPVFRTQATEYLQAYGYVWKKYGQVERLCMGIGESLLYQRKNYNLNLTFVDRKYTYRPCIEQHQFTLDPVNRVIDLTVFQRSMDVAIGGCVDVLQGWMLLKLICQSYNLTMGSYRHVVADAHIYDVQQDALTETLSHPYSFQVPADAIRFPALSVCQLLNGWGCELQIDPIFYEAHNNQIGMPYVP